MQIVCSSIGAVGIDSVSEQVVRQINGEGKVVAKRVSFLEFQKLSVRSTCG